ncbi:MAG: hypothetical protein KC621_03805, partial [Myxococcales bacterium]|nr:hypothetical protein [Myxococcales bacterium]
ALLANVWMDGALRVVDVARTGLETLKDDKIAAAAETGARYRLVAEVERSSDGNIRASVEPVALEPGDPLYALRGNQGGVVLDTDAGQRIVLLQQTAGVEDAALGMVQDCRAILGGFPQV